MYEKLLKEAETDKLTLEEKLKEAENSIEYYKDRLERVNNYISDIEEYNSNEKLGNLKKHILMSLRSKSGKGYAPGVICEATTSLISNETIQDAIDSLYVKWNYAIMCHGNDPRYGNQWWDILLYLKSNLEDSFITFEKNVDNMLHDYRYLTNDMNEVIKIIFGEDGWKWSRKEKKMIKT